MPRMRREPAVPRPIGPCFILLGLIALMLLPAAAQGQSAWGPGVTQSSPIKPAAPAWLPSRCPLAPASVFSLQTNFRKYLETWPTPGSTATEAWPEYIPEDEDSPD